MSKNIKTCDKINQKSNRFDQTLLLLSSNIVREGCLLILSESLLSKQSQEHSVKGNIISAFIAWPRAWLSQERLKTVRTLAVKLLEYSLKLLHSHVLDLFLHNLNLVLQFSLHLHTVESPLGKVNQILQHSLGSLLLELFTKKATLPISCLDIIW